MSRTNRIDRLGAEWAYSVGREHRGAYPNADAEQAAKLNPFIAETPHARYWKLGWNGIGLGSWQ